MHSNTWTTVLLISIPAGLSLLIGLLQWINKQQLPRKTFILTVILALIPLFFILGHIISRREEMNKRQGIYTVIESDKIPELCNSTNVDSLQLTLLKSGIYSFNFKPCFANKKEGKWKWQDDMVGAYAVFDLEISNYAYLHFDDKDTLRLIKEGRNYLTFAKQPLQK